MRRMCENGRPASFRADLTWVPACLTYSRTGGKRESVGNDVQPGMTRAGQVRALLRT